MISEVRIDDVSFAQGEAIPQWIPNAEPGAVAEASPALPISEPDRLNEREPPAAVSFRTQDDFRGLARKRDLLAAFEARPSEVPDGEAPVISPIDSNVSDVSPTAEEDFTQLGAAFAGRRPPQVFWNEETINTISAAGLTQGGLSTEQAEMDAQVAGKILAPETTLDTEAPRSFIAGDLALALRESGLAFSLQDPGQLTAAASYLNEANDLADQRERLRKTLDTFHTLDSQGMPQLTRDQMIGELWVAARVPTHAIEKMSNAEMARTYQDVAAAVNGPAGQHKLKVGEHEVTLTVNGANQVVDSQTKKPSIWGKIGKIALTVASFVPGPVGIAARIASSVVSAAEGIKNKSWVQAVIGGASGVAAGASAIAGRAVAGAAATTARVADSIAKGARAWQAGFQAYRAQDAAGIFKSLAGAGAAVSGALGDSAETVAGWARNVETWAGRAYVAAEVRNISRMNWQDKLLAVGTHAVNMILDSGDLRPASSSFELKWKLGINMGQTVRAGLRLHEAVKSGDVLLMSEAASSLSAVTENAYRNAAAAPSLMRFFEAQAQNTPRTPPSGSDLQYDGAWIGSQGATSSAPALPDGGLQTNIPTVYVNGVLNSVADQTRFMQGLANATGSAVFGIHNASQGIFRDIWQSLEDKFDKGKNPAVDTLAAYVHEQLVDGNGVPVNLVGHSQGALIISRALDDVTKQMIKEGYSDGQVEAMLSRVTVTTFGGASGHYPNGPQYFHYVNRGDYVAMPAGLGGDLLAGVPLLQAGRGATTIRFTDFSLPNPHDSNIYLRMYRPPQSFANKQTPYTPDEIRRYGIGR